MTKVLNLDALDASTVRELVLGGKTYAVREMSVADFVETTEAAKRLAEVDDLSVHMRETVRLVKRAIPGVSEKDLMALSLPNLRAVVAFVRGEDPAEKTEGVTEGN